MYVIIVKMKPLPAKRKELILTLTSIVEEVRHRQGHLQAGIYQNLEDETSLLFVQEWATRQSAESLLSSDLFIVLRGAGSLTIQPPEFMTQAVGRLTAIEVEPLELLYQKEEQHNETEIC